VFEYIDKTDSNYFYLVDYQQIMPASQQHGFAFQTIVEEEVFGVYDLPISYTAIHDIPKEFNKFNPNENVSIKVTGSNSIGMGDVMRIYDYTPDELHTAIVIYYRQRGDRKTIHKVVEFSLDDKRALFGDITRDEIETLIREIRSVPPNIPLPELNIRRARINQMTKELSKRSALRFNSKIDSKTQRRLQCTLTVIPPSLVRYSEDAAVVRGVWITNSIVSGQRTRKNRV
jgi:hypothetical protein